MATERILVVDDEDSIREIVCSMLGSAGYPTASASSGIEALGILESGEQFALMLSDMMMAGMDGLALLERTKERIPDMPVIMVTAVHDISVALGSIRNGAYDYLLKPFEREQLLATVRRALENRRLRLENRSYQIELEARVEKKTEQLRNTMPPATIAAFQEHGMVALTVEQGVAAAQQTMHDLDAIGISITQVTNILEQEGVATFKTAFEDLLHTLDDKRRALAREQAEQGDVSAARAATSQGHSGGTGTGQE